MRPGQTPMIPNQPAPLAGRSRRRQDLTLPLPQRDPTALAVPLPLPLPPPSTSGSGSGPPSSGSGSGSGSSSSSASGTPQTAHVFAQPQIIPALADLERVRRVGSGSGGSVWMVRHRPTGRIYALKNIYGHHEESVRRQICREIEILRTADSPFVVRCHGMYDQGGEIQILLEYMDVGSLNGRRITSETVLADVARQVLAGLHYLHRRRIVHRDIKPANLLLNTAGQVKIADFGVSRILAQTMDPTCNSSVGTIAYMSPERINTELNHGAYDGYAGDIWSFGISMLEFYLGHFPFGENLGRQGDWASLMLAICYSNPPEAPPTASREFRSFIACCLQKEPSRRLTAQKLLHHPFVAQPSPSSLQPPNSLSTHHP